MPSHTASASLSAGTANPAPSPSSSKAEPMPPLVLYMKTYLIRFFQTIGRWCDLYLSKPLPHSPSFSVKIPSTVAKSPGKIPLLFYTPKEYMLQRAKGHGTRASKRGSQQPLLSRRKFPILINMHGGGYTIGHPADDARWATQVINTPTTSSTLPPVVISIGYRLAPSHPFPTGIEDCVSAILWIWAHAEEYDLDPSLTTLSGFSAGAQFCFTALYRLHEELEKLRSLASSRENDVALGKIVSLVAFYPPTDWTKTRAERAATNPNFNAMVPPFFQKVMEQAYFTLRPPPMAIPLLSPGLASDELVVGALPEKMVIITCWTDGLLHEAEVFRERLKKLGKKVEGYTVPGVPHGWDKWPSWSKGNPSRDEAYAKAVGWLMAHLEEEGTNHA